MDLLSRLARWMLAVLLAIALSLIGYLFGRFSQPAEIAQLTATGTASPLPPTVPRTETPIPLPSETPEPSPTTAPTEPPPPTEVPPTPVPEIWPEPLAGPALSKAGLHVIRNNDPRIMEFVRRMKPAVMKAVDDLGWLRDVKQASPGTITIGRISRQDTTVVGNVDPVAYARQYVDERMETYRLNPGADYWEGWNEYDPPDAVAWDWFTRFEAERVCYMASNGLRAAIGGFPTGVPEYDEMARFIPAMQAAQQCGGMLTVHEYAAPTMQCGVGIGIPGAPQFSGVPVGITTLRYRFWYEGYLKPMGLDDVRLVISEVGIDGGARFCDGPHGGGWNSYRDWWLSTGMTADSIGFYLDQIKWYDAEVRRDPYVLGFTIYTAGAPGDSWDVHDLIIPLAFYLAGG